MHGGNGHWWSFAREARGGELPHCCDAVRVRQLHLRLAVAPLAFARFCFCPLALGQVQHERDALAPDTPDRCGADQHRHAAAVGTAVNTDENSPK
jgi:hypothetical protein